MIPAGYLLKRLAPPPQWLLSYANHLKDVCSVASCVNGNIVDVQASWQHNSFGVANNPETLWSLANTTDTSIDGSHLFFYTGYELCLPSDGWSFDKNGWRARSPALSAGVADDVMMPPNPEFLTLLGYDVVVFGGNYLEHSPLSCNDISGRLGVNEHCLLVDFAQAKFAIDSGGFGGGCEEGFYTIFSVSVFQEPLGHSSP